MNRNDIKYGFVSDLENPFNVYLLGLWWADAHVCHGLTAHCCVLEDAEWLDPLIRDFGVKTIYGTYRNQANRKKMRPQWVMRINSVDLSDFLMKYDYHIKSGASPDKLLSDIPENLRHLWWRGYFDGDGTIHPKPAIYVSFCSVKEQDWSFFHNCMRDLGIDRYGLRRVCYNNGKWCHSTVSLNITNHVVKLMKWIYQDWEINKLGLERKYLKYLKLMEYQNGDKRKQKSSKFRYVSICSATGQWTANIDTARLKKFLGRFSTEEEAAKKVEAFLKEHPEFDRPYKNIVFV